MIGLISGKVDHISLSRVVVNVSGVGYVIYTTLSNLERIKLGSEITFFTHTAVRENDISLYGFETEDELVMFEKLLGVSGIGPKSGLAIISVAGVRALEEAVISGNTAVLTKIAGIGRKTADKIVLELSGKVVSHDISESMKDDLDVLEALKSLGYREHEIKEVLKKVPAETSGANDKIKYALKTLGGASQIK